MQSKYIFNLSRDIKNDPTRIVRHNYTVRNPLL